MNSQFYTLTALTNLHVGSGDSHYGIIDNLVQRDVLTKYPSIHSSSLKGALREAFENTPGLSKENLRKLFGDSPRSDKENPKNDKPGLSGSYAFGSPHLLSFPVRSNKVPFLRVTSPGLMKHLLDSEMQFGFAVANRTELDEFAKAVKSIATPTVFERTLNEAILERHTLQATYVDNRHYSAAKRLFGDNLAIVPDEVLAKLCGENRLPVIARNSLDNGISRNLWYEEVVPRQTRFWFWVHPKKNEPELRTDFDTLLKSPVQIGANASIGYGFCEIKHHV